MFKKARAFIALIAFVTIAKCDITIFDRKTQQQLAIAFKDEVAYFGPSIPIEGVKVYFFFIIY